jgi:serine/threonine protein kinase
MPSVLRAIPIWALLFLCLVFPVLGEEPLKEGDEPRPGYKLVRFLGRGGFGEVWEADHEGKKVALKFVKQGPGSIMEQKALMMLNDVGEHPNILKYKDLWMWNRYAVMSSEMAHGTLEDLLELSKVENNSPLSSQEVHEALVPIAEALDFLNKRQHRVGMDKRLVGIQHADAKPANMFIMADTIKLADFGLAITTTSSAAKRTDRRGTTAYTAPEVWAGQLSDKIDQFSLAVSYVFLRTGVLPFPNLPLDFVDGYRHPAPQVSGLSDWEQGAIVRGLHPTPAMRYSTCIEMMNALRAPGEVAPPPAH